jgi:hypothetical protein
MTYTSKEYAEAAVKANECGKLLIVNRIGELQIVDKKNSKEEVIIENTMRKNTLLSEANQQIAILQDIIDLDMQESNEDEQLKNWKKYRILLTRVDVNSENVVFPEKP